MGLREGRRKGMASQLQLQANSDSVVVALSGYSVKDCFDQWNMGPREQTVWKLDIYMTLQVTQPKILFTHVGVLRSTKV